MIGLGVDPDTKATGVALVERCFGGKFRLLFVGAAVADKGKMRERLPSMGAAVKATILVAQSVATTVALDENPLKAAIEWQNFHPDDKRPDNIVQLNSVAGMALASLESPEKALIPLPVQWKGTVPKAVHQKRILAKLSQPIVWDSWKVARSNRTHVVDAIGLAIYAVEQAVGKNLRQDIRERRKASE